MSAAGQEKPDPKNSESKTPAADIELRGRVVCLAEEMNRLHGANLPTHHDHVFGFKTDDGTYYALLRTKYSEALFADEKVRAKELLLKGRIFPRTQIFEPITLRSVRNGAVYELVYYCAVCEIYSVAPGICQCCQGPTELTERPLDKK